MSQSTRVALDSYNLNNAEKLLCEAALQRAGNISGAAKLLGVTRSALRWRLKKYAIHFTARAKAANTRPSQAKRRLN